MCTHFFTKDEIKVVFYSAPFLQWTAVFVFKDLLLYFKGA